MPKQIYLNVIPPTGNSEEAYFADGMVAEITTAISRLPWLFVIARNSQFHACESLLDPRFAGATRVDAT